MALKKKASKKKTVAKPVAKVVKKATPAEILENKNTALKKFFRDKTGGKYFKSFILLPFVDKVFLKLEKGRNASTNDLKKYLLYNNKINQLERYLVWSIRSHNPIILFDAVYLTAHWIKTMDKK